MKLLNIFEEIVREEKPFVKPNNTFLYHTTNIKNLNDITKYGLLPDFGDTIKTAYGGDYDFDKKRDAYSSYSDFGDDDDEGGYDKQQLDFDGILFFSDKPMLGYSQTMQQKFRWEEALLCIIKKNDTIFHKVNDYPKFTDYKNFEVSDVNYISTENLPIFIETGDWFSFEEQNPVKLLYGQELINFMQLYYKSEHTRLSV